MFAIFVSPFKKARIRNILFRYSARKPPFGPISARITTFDVPYLRVCAIFDVDNELSYS